VSLDAPRVSAALLVPVCASDSVLRTCRGAGTPGVAAADSSRGLCPGPEYGSPTGREAGLGRKPRRQARVWNGRKPGLCPKPGCRPREWTQSHSTMSRQAAPARLSQSDNRHSTLRGAVNRFRSSHGCCFFFQPLAVSGQRQASFSPVFRLRSLVLSSRSAHRC